MEAQKKMFWEKGFYILNDFIPHCLLEQIYELKENYLYESIFEEVYGSMDLFRFQAKITNLSNPPLKQLSDIVNDHILNMDMKWYTSKFVFLKSLPGGRNQDYHHDFPSYETGKAYYNYKTVQAGMLIALQSNTALRVLGKEGSNRLVLKKGDVMIFRGDFIHSGCAYTELNYRIHVTLNVTGIKSQLNVTEYVIPKIYKCKHCILTNESRIKINNHQRTCISNPFKERLQLRKKELNKGQFFVQNAIECLSKEIPIQSTTTDQIVL